MKNNKKKVKQRNFVLKNMMVGEHGAKRTIVVHRSKNKYYRKVKHKGSRTDGSASFFYYSIQPLAALRFATRCSLDPIGLSLRSIAAHH